MNVSRRLRRGAWEIAYTTDGAWLIDEGECIIAGTFERIEDAVFSAHAPEDIPKLLAEIERLENEINRLEIENKTLEKVVTNQKVEISRDESDWDVGMAGFLL